MVFCFSVVKTTVDDSFEEEISLFELEKPEGDGSLEFVDEL